MNISTHSGYAISVELSVQKYVETLAAAINKTEIRVADTRNRCFALLWTDAIGNVFDVVDMSYLP